MTQTKLPELRRVLVEILSDVQAPFELVVVAAETIALDARVDDWFVRDLKKSGSDELVLRVLEATDKHADDCLKAWLACKTSGRFSDELVGAVRNAKDEFLGLLESRE